MLTDDLQGAGELLDDDRLGFHAVAFGQALVCHGDRCSDRGAVVRRQNRFEYRRPDRVSPAAHVERELGGELVHAHSANALPLRPDQAEVDVGR